MTYSYNALTSTKLHPTFHWCVVEWITTVFLYEFSLTVVYSQH